MSGNNGTSVIIIILLIIMILFYTFGSWSFILSSKPETISPTNSPTTFEPTVQPTLKPTLQPTNWICPYINSPKYDASDEYIFSRCQILEFLANVEITNKEEAVFEQAGYDCGTAFDILGHISMEYTVDGQSSRICLTRSASNIIKGGPLNWHNLPNTTSDLEIYNVSISGPMSIAVLPKSLEQLNIISTSINGSIDLMETNLFQKLRFLRLSDNQLTFGSLNSIHLKDLAPSVEFLFITKSDLYGDVNVSMIPSSLQVLDVSHNKLSGSIFNLGNLPSVNRGLFLNDNKLKGTIDFATIQLPKRRFFWEMRFQNNPDLQVMNTIKFPQNVEF